ncbi:MAG: hypothetical protein WAU60_06880 [Candidatus Competibacter denitrificans]|jgi:hypothetical protein
MIPTWGVDAWSKDPVLRAHLFVGTIALASSELRVSACGKARVIAVIADPRAPLCKLCQRHLAKPPAESSPGVSAALAGSAGGDQTDEGEAV